MNPPFHPPSVCPSANLSPFHLPHTETRQWGPHPSSVFRHFCPAWGTHFYTGAPVSVFCTSFPNLFIIIVQTPFSQPFTVSHFVVTVGDLPSFFGHTQPMSPLVGASLLIHPRRHRLYLQSTTQVIYHLSSEFVHLVPPLAQLSPGLVVPLTLDLVTWLRPLFLSISPPTKGSLESSHFLTSSMYLCHFITSVDSTEYLFASGSRVTFLSTSAHFFQKGDSILVLISHSMSDLGRHRGKHHGSLMSLTPITFDANTFSCCGGSYFATIAVFSSIAEDL
jgi:hypothetical protein